MLTYNIGAFEQAPKHSTSSTVHIPSADVYPNLHPVYSSTVLIISAAPHNIQGVVPQI